MIRLVKSTIGTTVGTSVALAVTRSGATATRVNEKGLLELVAANSPRFDYNPVTLACKGLLVEESRDNLVLQSENLATTWSSIGTPTLTSLAYAKGILDLDLLGDDDAAAVEGKTQNITFTGNAVKAVSVFVKQGTAPSGVIRLRDTSASADRLRATFTWPTGGGTPTVAMQTGTSLGVDDYGDGIYRLRFQSTSVTAANTNALELYGSNDASGTVSLTGTTYYGGSQAENAVTVSSYVPTTTATVTRSADAIADTSIASWLNTIEGSLVASAMFDTIGLGSDTPALAALCDNTANEEIQFYATRSSGARAFKVVDGGVSQADISPSGTIANNTPVVMAAAYKANDFAVSVDAAAASTDVSGTLPTVTRLRFGSSGAGANFLNGWLRGVSYYRSRLSNGDLQSLSAGLTIATPAAITWDFSGGALVAATGDLTRSRIAYQTWTRSLTATSVTASAESVDAPRDAPLDQETWNRWRPTAAPATWRVDFGAVKAFDYALLLGSFGTSAAKIQLEHSDDDATWRWLIGGIAPTNDDVVLVLFPTQRARYLRLTLDAIADVQVVMAGVILTMEKSVQSAHRPLSLQKETELSTTRSSTGQFLGRTIRRKGFRGSVAFKSITPSWWRTYMKPFTDDARLYPYGFAWDPQDGPDDVAYCEAEADIQPSYMADVPLFETAWTMTGYDA